MKRITLIASLLFLYLGAFGQITFNEGNIEEVLTMADGEEQLIFVDVYTTWCGPCKWLSANHFQDEEVGNFFNQNFIALKVDAEKGDGIDFAKKYNVNAYPTLLFINGEGTLIHKMVGAPQNNEALIQLGQNAMDPESQLYALGQLYKENAEEPRILRNYAKALAYAGEADKAGEVAEQFFGMMPISELQDPEVFELFAMTTNDINSDLFMTVFKDREFLIEAHGDTMINGFFDYIVDNSIMKASRAEDGNAYEELKARIIEMYEDDAKSKLALLDYRYYSNMEPELGHSYAKIYLESDAASWSDLNEAAWSYYRKVEDGAMLADALKWAQMSIQLEKNYYNTDTEAHLLYKLKRWKEAKASVKVAIETGKEAGEDVTATEQLLEKIKAKK